MAKYATLFNFTQQGIKAIKASPGRVKTATAAAEEMGIQIHAIYYTQGPYDMVVISEAADEKAANAFMLALGAQGNVTTMTMQAWDPSEFEEIVARMPG